MLTALFAKAKSLLVAPVAKSQPFEMRSLLAIFLHVVIVVYFKELLLIAES